MLKVEISVSNDMVNELEVIETMPLNRLIRIVSTVRIVDKKVKDSSIKIDVVHI